MLSTALPHTVIPRGVKTSRLTTSAYLVASLMALGLLLNLSLANIPGLPGALVNMVLMVAWLYFAVLILERQVVGVVTADQAERVTAALGSLGLPTHDDPDTDRAQALSELHDLALRDRS